MKNNLKNNLNNDILKRIKLLMKYDTSKTLNENIISDITTLNEQTKSVEPPSNMSTYDWYLKNVGKRSKEELQKQKEFEIEQIKLIKGYVDSLKIDGPYRIEDGKEWIDKNIILDNNGIAQAYFYLNNNSNRPLEIKNITSNFEEGKITITYDNRLLKPKDKIKIYLKILETVPQKNTTNNQESIDNTFVKKPQIQIINKQGQNSTITIETNLGKISTQVKYGISEVIAKFQSMVLNYKKRLSIPGGYKVPDGYSPFNYDEFLREFEKLCKICPNLKNQYKQLLVKEQSSVIGMPVTKPIPQREVDCNSKLEQLKKKYYNEKFIHGITPEDKEEFDKEYSSLNSQLENFKKKYQVTRMREPYDQYFDETRLGLNDKKIYDDILKKIKSIEDDYGYDVRNTFDRMMDSELGHIIVIGSIIVLFIAGFVTEGATWVTAAELMLNTTLGSYYMLRGNPQEAFLYFMFAGLTKLHGFYEVVGSKVSKLFKEGENIEAISQSIAKKLTGVRLSNQLELKVFMNKILTKSERKLFKEVIKQAKEQPDLVKNSLADFSEKIASSRGLYRDIPWYKAEKLVPNLKDFTVKGIIDLKVTLPSIRGIYNEIKNYFKQKGVDISWGQNDNETIEYLAEHLTKEEQRLLLKNMMAVAQDMTVEEMKTYGKELSQSKPEEIEKYSKYTPVDVENKKKEIEKKVKEVQKKQQQITDPEYFKNKRKEFQDRLNSNPSVPKDSTNTLQTNESTDNYEKLKINNNFL